MNSPRRAILILLVLAAPCVGIAPRTAQQKNEEAEALGDKLRVEVAMFPVTVTDKNGGR